MLCSTKPTRVNKEYYLIIKFLNFTFWVSGAPCLSFDIIPDGLGNDRSDFPLTSYLIAGTQAPTAFTNRLVVMKMSNMQKTQPKEESDSDESDDEEEDMTPTLECAIIHHQGSVNRVRVSTCTLKTMITAL